MQLILIDDDNKEIMSLQLPPETALELGVAMVAEAHRRLNGRVSAVTREMAHSAVGERPTELMNVILDCPTECTEPGEHWHTAKGVTFPMGPAGQTRI